jgi:DNA repair protein RecO (recombination protein O)
MKQVDKGIFLHRISYSESSIIATFYTLEHGIQTFLYQGAKKKKSNLFPLNIVELTLYKRPDSELAKLTQTDTIHSLQGILTNPIKNIIAFFVADVVRNCLTTNEKEVHLFSFLEQTVLQLEQTQQLGDFPLRFLADFTHYIGIQPSDPEEQPLYFNYQEGEFHPDFRVGEICAEGALASSLHHLFFFPSKPIQMKKELLEAMLRYYSMHIPRFNVSKSLEVIREVLQD